MKSKLGVAILMLLTCMFQVLAQEVVNPLQYGLKEAKNGNERYSVLLKCHQDAVKKNAAVSYSGVGSIEIEIPQKFTSIPLTAYTDFAGCTIKVLNKQKKVCLYSMTQKTQAIEVPARCIDKADFRSVNELKSGTYLLIITDKNLWVDNRIGYNYGHTRKDVMLVRNGVGSNKPVMPYDNPQSNAECSFCKVDMTQKAIRNLTVIRDSRSTAITNIITIDAQNNVLLENISVTTPKGSSLVDDRMIRIKNCTNVAFENIKVDGTYSATDHSGYAFNMNNIWNHTAHNVTAIGNWGVYGTNNINKALIDNCDLNRFDIHCYGRDITSRKSVYRNLYNQFSATYGEIRYDNCTFIDFIPYLNAGSYNAYTPVCVVFDRCTFNLVQQTGKTTSLTKITGLAREPNKRPELSQKNLPNFSFSNCIINIDKNLKKWYFFNFGSVKNVNPLGNISNITMKNVTINGDAAFDISNVAFETEKPLNINFNKVYKANGGKKEKLQMQPVTVGKNVTVRCNRKLVKKK